MPRPFFLDLGLANEAWFGLMIPAGPFYLMGLILRFLFICQRGK